MKRTELGLIPLTYPTPSGRPPVVNRLALFGAPSPAIGNVVCAISTIDTAGGWIPDGSGGIAPEKPPAGVKWWHVLVALFPISPFGAILGALIGHALSPSPVRGESAFDLTTPFAVIFWALTVAFFVRLFARPSLPMSMGQAIVVGTEGFEECHYSEFGGGPPKPSAARYDDPAQTWTLKAVAVTRNGVIGRVTEELNVVDIATGQTRASLSRALGAHATVGGDNFDEEIAIAYVRVLENAVRIKGARAEAARRAGQPIAFPILEGKPRQLVLTPNALEDHHSGQVRALPLGRLQVNVEKGVYTFSGGDGGPPIVLERPRIGDVFLLEALLEVRG